MQYLINVRKKASAKPGYTENEPRIQYAKVAFVRGVEDLRPSEIERSRRREVLEQAIEERGIEMDPKWPLSSVETGQAIPFVKVEPNRRQMGKAVYKGKLSIPDESVGQDNRRHRQYKRGVISANL
jgi:hypothetical protein